MLRIAASQCAIQRLSACHGATHSPPVRFFSFGAAARRHVVPRERLARFPVCRRRKIEGSLLQWRRRQACDTMPRVLPYIESRQFTLYRKGEVMAATERQMARRKSQAAGVYVQKVRWDGR